MGTVATVTGFLLFAGAAVITARRRSSGHGDDLALPVGLVFLALASGLRIDAVENLLIAHAPGGVHELAKHVTFVIGAVCLIAWVRTALTGRATNHRLAGVIATATACVLIAIFVLNGPWTSADLTNQAMDRPGMWVYWLVYYTVGAAAAGSFGWSAFLTFREDGPRYGWGMGVAAVGTVFGVGWAIVSVVNHASGNLQARGSALGQAASALILVATILVCVGGIGHLLVAERRRRRRKEDLSALHEHLSGIVSETRLPTSQKGVAGFHVNVEIMDALVELSAYADTGDMDRVRDLVGEAPREVHWAYQLDIAATRRGMDLVPASPDDWGQRLTNGAGLRRLGRAFRDQTTAESRREVAREVTGV